MGGIKLSSRTITQVEAYLRRKMGKSGRVLIIWKCDMEMEILISEILSRP